MGWVTYQGNRRFPLNSELVMQPREKLMERYKALTGAIRKPAVFLGMVFGGDADAWVARCEGIIR